MPLNVTITPCPCGDPGCTKVEMNSLTLDGKWEPEIAKEVAASVGALDALELLWREVVASGNANAHDFNWPNANRAARKVLLDAGRDP